MGVPASLSSVPDVSPYIQYVATNGQTVYPYPFPITEDSDLVVVINGVTQSTDSTYSVSGVGNSTGGNCTLNTGSNAGDIITLYRDVPIERISQIAQNSGFSSTVFNNEFNNFYLIAQQLEAAIEQCLQIPNTNNPAPTVTLAPANYAGKYLAFDQYGNPTPAALTSSGSITQAILGGLLFPQTSLEATAGITPTNYFYPPYSFERYGADPTGTNDSTQAIQSAINTAADRVFSFLGGTFKISAVTHAALTGVFGANSVCLKPVSNQIIDLRGCALMLAAGYSASSGAMIGNYTGAAISNFEVVEGVLNGNASNVTGTCSSIQLVDATNCHFRRVTSLNASYNGFGIRNYNGVSGWTSVDAGSYMCSVRECVVNGAGYIGIQMTNPVAVDVSLNQVYATTNNGIDFEGNNTGGDPGYGLYSKIAGNLLQGIGNVGIFLESLIDVQVLDNRVANTTSDAVYLNGINSHARNMLISGNKLSQKTQGQYGIYLNNAVGNCLIEDNFFDNFTSSIYCNGAQYAAIGKNYHRNIARYMVEYPTTSESLVDSYIGAQVSEDTPMASGGLPYIAPPSTCPSNYSGRAYATTFENATYMGTGVAMPQYQQGWLQLANNSGWGACALYNSGSDGKTRIYCPAGAGLGPGVFSLFPAGAGMYIQTTDKTYKIEGFAGDGNPYVQQWNGSSYADGNFASDFSVGLICPLYYSYWGSN